MSQPTSPPEAPDIEKRLRLYPYQIIGIPLMLLIPVLTLLGVLGPTRASTEASGDALRLSVEYPARALYQQADMLEIEIENTTDAPLDGVLVQIDNAYLSAFIKQSFNPAVTRITSEAYEIELDTIPPGERRSLTVDMDPDRYGQHEGVIIARSGGNSAEVHIQTFTYP